jgi:hypothetical protein
LSAADNTVSKEKRAKRREGINFFIRKRIFEGARKSNCSVGYFDSFKREVSLSFKLPSINCGNVLF